MLDPVIAVIRSVCGADLFRPPGIFVQSHPLTREKIRVQMPNRLSDAAFVTVLVMCGLALILVPIPEWSQVIAANILLAITTGFSFYLCLKYSRWGKRARSRDATFTESLDSARNTFILGVFLLCLLWFGLAVSLFCELTTGSNSGIWGTLISGLAGLLLLFNFRGATFAIAHNEVAVNFILKPAWLPVKRIEMFERIALGRATGLAWLVGAGSDLVVILTNRH